MVTKTRAHKGCSVRRGAAEATSLGWRDGFCGTHAPPLPPSPPRKPRAPGVPSQREVREAAAASARDGLRAHGVVMFDVSAAKGADDKAADLLAQISAYNRTLTA